MVRRSPYPKVRCVCVGRTQNAHTCVCPPTFTIHLHLALPTKVSLTYFPPAPPLPHSPRLASRQISGSRILLARSRFANISRVVGSVSCTLSFLTTHTHTLHYTIPTHFSHPSPTSSWAGCHLSLLSSTHFRYIFDTSSTKAVSSLHLLMSACHTQVPRFLSPFSVYFFGHLLI